MKDSLDLQDVKRMVFKINENFIENLSYLSKLDSTIGDGDHGITISRGFKEANNILNSSEITNIKEIFLSVSKSLLSKMGGASGPLFSTIFREMGNYINKEKTSITPSDFSEMLSNVLTKIIDIGKAKPGDKTMVDTLYPVVGYLKKSDEKDFKIIFKNIERIAKESTEKTKEMIAKKGRARYLNERSLGYQDPGATSLYLIFKSMNETINGEDQNEKINQ